MSPLFLGLLLW